MAEPQMRIVDGVRYRAEDAPQEQTRTTAAQTSTSKSETQHKARRPAKDARSGDSADDE